MNRKIILSLYIIIILLQGCASVNNHKDTSVINTTEQVQESHSEQTSESMMIPGNAQKSPSGYAYITLNQGNGIKPSDKDAVDIKIRALDFEGNVIDEGTGTLAMSHSTPFFEEMLSLMTIGETIRVWGESESRIWEIQMVSIDDLYSAPQDAGVIPDDAQLLSGFEDIYYKIVEPGTGDRISEGAALRIHGSRWKRNGEILESNRAGRGMLVLMTDEQKIADPIHHALFLEMNPGIHVRIWIPAKYENTDFDVVEDFWLTERLTQLETPMDFRAPENKENLIVIEDDILHPLRFTIQRNISFHSSYFSFS